MDPQRSRMPLVLGIVGSLACLGLVTVLVVGGLVLLVVTSDAGRAPGVASPVATTAASPTEPGTDPPGGAPPSPAPPSPAPSSSPPTAPAPTTDGPTAPTAAPADVVPPPGVAADQPYLQVSTSDEGPVVDVYVDFLCPHCRTFRDVQGDDLIQMALDRQITLRMHPRAMLDDVSDPVGYSGRAAHAAVCAYAENPEKWFPAEITLFENQPGPEGLTDAELVDLVGTAAEIDISTCQAEGTYGAWIQQVVEPHARQTTPGTPTVIIDGETFSGDLTRAGSVKAAVEAV